MQPKYEKLLQEQYGLIYEGSTRTRTGLICRTNKGLRELKKMRSSKQEIQFAHEIKQCLYQNGFLYCCPFYETVYGQPFFEWEEQYYVLEDVMNGTPIEEETPQDWIDGAALMAQMHKSAKGFLPKQQTKHTRFSIWEKRMIEVSKIKHRIEKEQKYTSLDLLILRNYDTLSRQSKFVLSHKYEYQQIDQKQKQYGVFCHNRCKGSNFYRQQNQQLCIGGFEYCSYDSSLLDICAYLKRLWQKNNENETLLLQVLQAYDNIYTLTKEELELLKILIQYPEKVLQQIHEDYNKRRICISPAMEQRMTELLQQELQMSSLYDYIQKI